MNVRVLAAALAAMFAVPACAAEALATGPGALSARAGVRIAIKVPRVLRMQLPDHPADVSVLEQDVARGEVVVRGLSVQIVSNTRSGYLLRARLHGQPFAGLAIDGLPVRLVFDGLSGTATQPTQVGARAPGSYRVEYRLRLAPDARPGRYDWPVALELQDP